MCNWFLKYLEKKFACLGQSQNDDDSGDDHSYNDSDHSFNDSDDSRHSSEGDENSYPEDSFKSYSEEESSGEDVVESTGRRGTRSSTYADCSSKITDPPDENTEAPDPIDQQHRKSSFEENTKKHVKLKVGSSSRKESEIQEKSPKLKQPRPRQTHKELPRKSFKGERLNQEQNLTKSPTVMDKTAMQKDDKRSNAAKQDEKVTSEIADRPKKSSMKVKRTEKRVNSNRQGKTKEKLKKEKKSSNKKPNEKPKNEEKKEKVKIPEILRGGNKKSTPSIPRKSTAPATILPKISSKKPELGAQMRKPMKANSSKIPTFSKGANKSLARRNVPTFATKSIQKRRP